MTLRCQYCHSSTDENIKETMLFIILEDENKNEILRLPLYLAADAVASLPNLEEAFKNIPILLNMIYESGKNNEEVKFITEDITLQ